MQMLGSRQGMGGGDRDSGGEREAGAARPAAAKPAGKAGGKFDDFEDDIPF
jgi:single-strand DNA-binding protein